MTKTISLADDAYDELVAVRREGESFSMLARRLARAAAKQDLFDPTLRIDMTKEEAEERIRQIYAWRDAPSTRRTR